MDAKLLFVLALVAFGLTGTAQADSMTSTTGLPSRKASVVMPLLKAWTANEDMHDIQRILGKPDRAAGGVGQLLYWYDLDDKTVVHVAQWLLDDPSVKEIAVITARKPGQAITTFYSRPKP